MNPTSIKPWNCPCLCYLCTNTIFFPSGISFVYLNPLVCLPHNDVSLENKPINVFDGDSWCSIFALPNPFMNKICINQTYLKYDSFHLTTIPARTSVAIRHVLCRMQIMRITLFLMSFEFLDNKTINNRHQACSFFLPTLIFHQNLLPTFPIQI